ncbi:MAG TPA: glycerophosphodiester phosphodiesterase [Gaiellaceae bacterium]|nr:glycerophosphodiester phosphodiesterase [Gaiellaceae bacterium]
MISLGRRDGRPLRIGHRGAAAIAPENTLPSFRAAVEVGVDLIEFDVIAGPDGALLVSHSVPELQAETPTLDDVLRFFAEEAPGVGVHLDLKRFGREPEVVEALRRFGLLERTIVSSVFLRTARRIAALEGPAAGITVPRAILRISDEGRGAPVGRWGLRVLRIALPYLVRPLLAATRAHAVVMHRSLVTPKSVRAVHRCGAAAITWTVDDPDEIARVDAAGVDGVVTNDPRLFAPRSLSTLSA